MRSARDFRPKTTTMADTCDSDDEMTSRWNMGAAAEQLAAALDGRDEYAAAAILGGLRDEREITDFKAIFRESKEGELEERIKSAFHNNKDLRESFLNKLMLIPYYRAKCLHHALHKLFIDRKTLAEVICCDVYIPETKAAFKEMYKKDIVECVKKATSNQLQTLLVNLLIQNQNKIEADHDTFLEMMATLLATRPMLHLKELMSNDPSLRDKIASSSKLKKHAKRALLLRYDIVLNQLSHYGSSIKHSLDKDNSNRPMMVLLWFERHERVEIAKALAKLGETTFLKKLSSPSSVEVFRCQLVEKMYESYGLTPII